MLGVSAYSDWFGLLVNCALLCCWCVLFVLLIVYCIVLLLGFGFRLDFDFFDVEFVDCGVFLWGLFGAMVLRVCCCVCGRICGVLCCRVFGWVVV